MQGFRLRFRPFGNRHHAARRGVHGGFAQLFRVHLAEPLEAADLDLVGGETFLGEPVLDGREFAFVQRIQPFCRPFIALRRHVDPIERRLGDEHVAARDQRREVAVEEGEQQRLDVRAIDVGIRHDDHLAIAQVGEVGVVGGVVRVDSRGSVRIHP